MYSAVHSGALQGVCAYMVSVEVDIARGLPAFLMVGSLSTEVRESRERVTVALKNVGLNLPPCRITVNLSPADRRKEGTAFDLPIAVGMLEAMELVPAGAAEGLLFLGELGLNGELKKARGVLPIVRAAAAEGIRECIVPGANAREGGVIPGIRVRGAENILEIMHFLMARGEERDRVLCRIAEEVCGREVTGSVFLIGDGFAGDWMKNTLRYLCRGRRVFQGNNLFGKGACCGMQERLKASQMGTEHVFLGGDKLKANVGMKILRNGEDSYFALLDAGVNWYEAERTAEIYLQEGRELEFSAAPLVRSRTGAEVLRLSLEGLPGTTARLRLHLYMEAENRLTVEAEDLGFGEFRPASGRSWKESFVIY